MQYELSQSLYVQFSRFLYENLGIVLGENKQYLVKSRLSAIARNHDYTSLDKFLEDLICSKDTALTNQCLELMTTNETFWFRDVYPFALLLTHLLPMLHKQQTKLRIWSSACASGQEPYSIAMTIAEYKRDKPQAFPSGIEIVASDFSSKMINTAQAGVYDHLALSRGLHDKYRSLYFQESHSLEHKKIVQVNDNIKRMVTFKRFNLLSEYKEMGQFDIIFCRNVLIYFDGNQKTNILKKFAACLPQSGALMLGAAESIAGAESIYKMQSVNKSLYYSKL